MSAVLNTNIASLWASKNLLGAQNKLAASVERLSSGLRINRARDDAAGLGVANSLTAQINGANQGMRNLNDAISMVQTAEGAIAAASDMGQRILMLATQAANSTLGSAERLSIQKEMQQLILSIDSIGSRTEFSGNALLSAGVGAVGTDLFKMQISNNADDVVKLKADAFQAIGGTTPVSYSQITAGQLGSLSAGTHSVYLETSSGASGVDQSWGVFDLTVSVDANGARSYKITDDSSGSLEAVHATATSNVYKLLHADTAATPNPASLTRTANSGTPDTFALDLTKYSNWTGTKTISLAGQTGQAEALSAAIDSADPMDSNSFRAVQTRAQSYVDALTSQRGLLGAYQNQMEYTLSNITELSSNLQSARSRVIDTDYASETASLTKGQILQQAATAMLAQANQMPNVILTLLK